MKRASSLEFRRSDSSPINLSHIGRAVSADLFFNNVGKWNHILFLLEDKF